MNYLDHLYTVNNRPVVIVQNGETHITHQGTEGNPFLLDFDYLHFYKGRELEYIHNGSGTREFICPSCQKDDHELHWNYATHVSAVDAKFLDTKISLISETKDTPHDEAPWFNCPNCMSEFNYELLKNQVKGEKQTMETKQITDKEFTDPKSPFTPVKIEKKPYILTLEVGVQMRVHAAEPPRPQDYKKQLFDKLKAKMDGNYHIEVKLDGRDVKIKEAIESALEYNTHDEIIHSMVADLETGMPKWKGKTEFLNDCSIAEVARVLYTHFPHDGGEVVFG